MNKQQAVWRPSGGFTIVELLIVIIVIAILATISVVAYSGITNRTNDTVIKSDLAHFSEAVQLYAAEDSHSGYPVAGGVLSGGTTTGNSTTIAGFTFTPSKGAYDTSVNNLYYCTGVDTTSGQNVYYIAARSKSGSSFRYSSTTNSIQDIGKVGIDRTTVCLGMDDPKYWAYGYYVTTTTWWTWIK